MRREELRTISAAHFFWVLKLNSDGTTKFQHKLNAAALNGIVLSIAEVPDGKAETVIRYKFTICCQAIGHSV